MSDDRSTEERIERAFRVWGHLGVPVDSEGEGERRDVVVDAVARAIRRAPAKQARSRWTRPLLACAAAASVALAIGATWRWVAKPGAGGAAPDATAVAQSGGAPALVSATVGTVVATRASSAAVVPAGRALGVSADDEIATGVDSRAHLDLPGSVGVEVGSASKVTVRKAFPLDGRLELLLGRVSVDVPPSGQRRSFVVVTPDAEVAVHGTAFVVEVQRLKSNGTVTLVTVSRGAVLVTRGASRTLLSAGGRWSSAPFDETDEVNAAEPRAGQSARRAATANETGSSEGEQSQTAPASAPRGEEQQAKASSERLKAGSREDDAVVRDAPSRERRSQSLAEQNRLFKEALDARNAGDDVGAARLLGKLLAQFPRSPLAHDARVARFRALRRSGNLELAALEASRYLKEYPNGSASGEARRLAGQSARMGGAR